MASRDTRRRLASAALACASSARAASSPACAADARLVPEAAPLRGRLADRVPLTLALALAAPSLAALLWLELGLRW